MEGLYEWIRNITYYLIFITVVENLLPNKKYEKYFRLFAGMVLILLVLKPFTSGLRLDDRLAYYFESISFKTEVSELTAELSGMESRRLESMISQYEEAVENDLKTMVDSSGFVCKKAEVSIDADSEQESFGHVVSVYLLLVPVETPVSDGAPISDGVPVSEGVPISGETSVSEETSAPGVSSADGGGPASADTSISNAPITPVEPVKVELETSKGTGKTPEKRREENSALTGLRRRIAEYYDLEEQGIEIQLENG